MCTYLSVPLLAVDGVLGSLGAFLPPMSVELPQLVLALEWASAQACKSKQILDDHSNLSSFSKSIFGPGLVEGNIGSLDFPSLRPPDLDIHLDANCVALT